MPKKVTTKTTAGRNGGIHDVRRYMQAVKWLTSHTFIHAQLWHIVFKGSDSRDDYKAVLSQLCAKLESLGMRVEWRDAYELCPTKGFHRHVFLMVEAATRKPVSILRFREGGWLVNLTQRYGLEFHIARPKNAIHHTRKGYPKKYAYVPKKPGPVLEDCKEWLSYIYKARSKEGVVGSIYSSSRNKTKKQPSTNQQEKDDNMELSASAHAYIAGHYKRFVGKDMTVPEIRQGLSDNGILRTLQQVRADLERYGHHGYAATHEAPRPLTLRELAKEDEDKIKKTRSLAAERPRKQEYEAGPRGIAGAILRRQQEIASGAAR